MCSYNAVNGVPSWSVLEYKSVTLHNTISANEWLLNKVARGDWGFEGYITSDCGAVSNVFHEVR